MNAYSHLRQVNAKLANGGSVRLVTSMMPSGISIISSIIGMCYGSSAGR